MSDTKEMLQHARERLAPPEDVMSSLIRRRRRKERNRRTSAAVIAVLVVLLSFAGLAKAFRSADRPASKPTPAPAPEGIFSEVGGWIVYGVSDPKAMQRPVGIWAVDPEQPDDKNAQILLSRDPGTPLAWSSDGSKLLISSYEPRNSLVPTRVFVLNADGTETTLATGLTWGSLSPDGSHFIYAHLHHPQGSRRSSIFIADTRGGKPRVLLTAGRLQSPTCGTTGSWLTKPTYSPDGTQIAYFAAVGDCYYQLRVMNADGSGVRVLADRKGHAGHISGLAWSPDGKRLAFGAGSSGVDIVGADGSGLSVLIPGGADPHWSPDGTRIAYRIPSEIGTSICPSCSLGALEIAASDGTHVRRFGYAEPGPWNPLVQPEPEVAEAAAVSESPTLTTALLLAVALLALVAGVAIIRRRSPTE